MSGLSVKDISIDVLYCIILQAELAVITKNAVIMKRLKLSNQIDELWNTEEDKEMEILMNL